MTTALALPGTSRSIQSAYADVSALIKRAEKKAEVQLERHENMVHGFTRTTSSLGGAFLTGVYQGRTGGWNFLGMPAEVFAFGLLKGASYFFGDGLVGTGLSGLGTGIGSALFARWGLDIGRKWASKVGAPGAAAGNDAASGRVGMRLSEAELNRMYQSMG